MNETTFLLAGDFLATVEPLSPSSSPPLDLPFEITLDNYTRDPWSSGSGRGDKEEHGWQTAWLRSTDGRKRLPGFVKYLRERKKSAVCKFDAGTTGIKALLVVPFDPPSPPEGEDASQLLFVKYISDERRLRKKAELNQQQQQQKQQHQRQQQQQQQQQKQATRPAGQNRPPAKAAAPKKAGGLGGGLLGSLLGAQRRTDNHLSVVRAPPKKTLGIDDLAMAGGATGAISDFRSKVEEKLLAFQKDMSMNETKINITLTKLISDVPAEERDRVTMDIFKYIVYEQVEEVGMDKWVAAKEPTDFIDEVNISVYKEGHCPPEVLEDMNKGDLPDEVKGHAQYLTESKNKIEQQKEKKRDELLQQKAMGSVSEWDTSALNKNKRDRRSMEQIQNDKGKKGRME